MTTTPAGTSRRATPWRRNDESAAWERGRSLGTLVTAGACITAILRILMTPDEPFPLPFVLHCALVAWTGFVVAVFSAQWQKHRLFSRAFRSLPVFLSLATLLVASGGTLFYSFFNARLVYRDAAKHFTCIEDRIDFIQLQTDLRIIALATADLAAAFTPEQIDAGVISADLRAIERGNYEGKGFFLATGRSTTETAATVILENETDTPLVIQCDGPTQDQRILAPHSADSIRLAPGTYRASASLQGNYTIPPIQTDKRVVSGGLYRGILRKNTAGYLAVGELAHRPSSTP